MKIINNCIFETKCIKDLLPGEVFLHHGVPFIKIQEYEYLCRQGYAAVDLQCGALLFFKDPNQYVKIVNAELYCDPCIL